MKTIDELLKEGLTPEHYRLIMKYYKPYWDTDAIYEDAYYALKGSTSWMHTDEGDVFWRNICMDLLRGTYIKHSNNIFLKI